MKVTQFAIPVYDKRERVEQWLKDARKFSVIGLDLDKHHYELTINENGEVEVDVIYKNDYVSIFVIPLSRLTLDNDGYLLAR